ncbi:MAG: hypothetical protein LC713_05375 [Actinobacteria bacterium]|nr:hypothetical protein [Actinomycetota bacterium]
MDPGDLYALPLDRFVPERVALAKTLRRDGRRDEAAGVAARRKPSVGAWAVNQLVRTQPAGLDRLFAAGDAVREAQAELLDGRGDARALRAAADAERAAVADLIETARGLLTSAGHELSPAVLDRVADTLHAAGLDPVARDPVRDGCLERELVHVGLGSLSAGPPAPPGSKPDPKPAGDTPSPPPAKPAGDTPSPPPPKPAGDTPSRPPPKPGPKPAGDTPAETPVPRPPKHTPKAAADAPRPSSEDRAETQRRDRAVRAEERAEERAEAKRIERERAAAHREARAAEAAGRTRVDRAARAVGLADERRDLAAQKLADADEVLAGARAEAKDAAEAHRRARAELDPE